jgi:hypothetical protein
MAVPRIEAKTWASGTVAALSFAVIGIAVQKSPHVSSIRMVAIIGAICVSATPISFGAFVAYRRAAFHYAFRRQSPVAAVDKPRWALLIAAAAIFGGLALLMGSLHWLDIEESRATRSAPTTTGRSSGDEPARTIEVGEAPIEICDQTSPKYFNRPVLKGTGNDLTAEHVVNSFMSTLDVSFRSQNKVAKINSSACPGPWGQRFEAMVTFRVAFTSSKTIAIVFTRTLIGGVHPVQSDYVLNIDTHTGGQILVSELLTRARKDWRERMAADMCDQLGDDALLKGKMCIEAAQELAGDLDRLAFDGERIVVFIPDCSLKPCAAGRFDLRIDLAKLRVS